MGEAVTDSNARGGGGGVGVGMGEEATRGGMYSVTKLSS